MKEFYIVFRTKIGKEEIEAKIFETIEIAKEYATFYKKRELIKIYKINTEGKTELIKSPNTRDIIEIRRNINSKKTPGPAKD